MEQNSNNPKNSTETNNNMNLKQKYNALKQKIANLEKNNNEMLEMYKAEEQRLIKSNEFLMQDNKSNKNTDTNNDTFSTTKNTLTKQYSAKDITNHPNPKAATFFQKNKPNLNITKFSNSEWKNGI